MVDPPTVPAPDPAPPRRGRGGGFAPTVLAGVAAGGLAALSSRQDWARADVAGGVGAAGSDAGPAALALSLVALAAWGVLLVVRHRTRRAAAMLGAAASLGVLVVVVASADEARAAAVRAQAAALAGPADRASLTVWFLVAAVSAAVCAGCFLVAAVAAGRWPEMSRRYDAGGGAPAGTPQDAWRALDEGRDPTV